MEIAILASVLYAIIAGLAIMMTLREQRKTGGRPLAQMIVGVLACLVWPVTALVVLATIHRRSA